MVFYSFLRIIKNIAYSFRGVFKYLFYSLLLIVFIILCLLLLQSSVFAYDGTAWSEGDITHLESIRQNYQGNYTDYSYTLSANGTAFIHIFNNPIGNKLYMESMEGMNSTDLMSGLWFRLDGQGNVADSGTFSNIHFQPYVTKSLENGYYYYGSQPLYASDETTIIWSPTRFNPAYLDNVANSTLYQKTVAGECPRSVYCQW